MDTRLIKALVFLGTVYVIFGFLPSFLPWIGIETSRWPSDDPHIHFQTIDAEQGILAGTYTDQGVTVIFEARRDKRQHIGFLQRAFYNMDIAWTYGGNQHYCTTDGDCFIQGGKPWYVAYNYVSIDYSKIDPQRRNLEVQLVIRAGYAILHSPSIPASMYSERKMLGEMGTSLSR